MLYSIAYTQIVQIYFETLSEPSCEIYRTNFVTKYH